MAVTIKDVAALAGVSPSTVSRTCKDNPSISNETKEKVRRAMAELGYEAGIQATSSQDSKIICIILPPSPRVVYENPFYLEAIRGMSKSKAKKVADDGVMTRVSGAVIVLDDKTGEVLSFTLGN